jgi:hypothetical protein
MLRTRELRPPLQAAVGICVWRSLNEDEISWCTACWIQAALADKDRQSQRRRCAHISSLHSLVNHRHVG